MDHLPEQLDGGAGEKDAHYQNREGRPFSSDQHTEEKEGRSGAKQDRRDDNEAAGSAGDTLFHRRSLLSRFLLL